MDGYLPLWNTLRQVLDIADRSGAGWCRLWTELAHVATAGALNATAHVADIPGGVHHYLTSVVPTNNQIELDGTLFERTLRERARALEIREVNIPIISGGKLIGEIPGIPGERAVLDGTADQFLGSIKGVYGGMSRVPKQLLHIYTRKNNQ